MPLSRAERLALLTGFAERLVAALVAEEFSEKPAYDVGDALVEADFAAPETLGATIRLIDEDLLAVAGARRRDAGGPGSRGCSARWRPATAGPCATARSTSRRRSGPPRSWPASRPSGRCATARPGSGTPPCTTR